MVTIKEVAQHAGVSVATVSRYMNKKGYVSEAASKKIAQSIDELKYVPNEVARSLFQKTSKLIGVIFPDIANPYFPLVAKGIEEELIRNGLMMILANTSDSFDTLKQYVTTFNQNNVSGIITAVPIPDELVNRMTIVGIDRVYEGDFPKVLSDDYGGGQLIADHILATPFDKLLILPGDLDIPSSAERFKGLTDKFKSCHIDYGVIELNSYNNQNMEASIDKIEPYFSKYDTIVAANDYLALHLIKRAQSMGIKIPEQLQIVGYDGIPFSNLVTPKLTTVVQSAYEIGQEAAKQMISLLNEADKEQLETIIMPVTFEKGATLRK
ncbi:LacI family DNA-binding transcriptional regulator [Vagococcus xieshaowenii]|uniref:LacI family transcriptional regulator n=1 Tax=Vagococcus xieshaowenii TaxID=2562451 RepID=A0AAJ5EGH3_9ENTE|nr:LacI family DNA-binding transcriptional regulator [Vagococcus xieshaowenii]QCA28909.1 LacI family transcriptional regulator [Vagococcus xieshaowenii]TFZ43327.1 LacI family transcriptional regulator [Vagococcus xieshaowenii]